MTSTSLNRSQPTVGVACRRALGRPIPAEGENGLYSQSWFPLCLSREVEKGQVRGEEFLAGRVVIFRGDTGIAQVLSAYRPHLGADLSVGDAQGDRLRCAFHHGEYNQHGMCVQIAVGDPPREEPLFEIPDFPCPAEDLVLRVESYAEPFPVDPWVICCNTPDVQPLKALHGVTFDHLDPDEEIEWTAYRSRSERDGSPTYHRDGPLRRSRYGRVASRLPQWCGDAHRIAPQ